MTVKGDADVPERMNCAFLVELPDDSDIRPALIKTITSIFSRWFSDPIDIAIIDASPEGVVRKWKYPDEKHDFYHKPSGDEIFAIYFNSVDASGSSMICIHNNIYSFVYTISISNHLFNRDDFCTLLISLQKSLSKIGIHSVVVAGVELEIGGDITSVEKLIRAASLSRDSLVQYLCCDKRDLFSSIYYNLIQEDGSSLIFERNYNRE